MAQERATRRSCNYDRAKGHIEGDQTSIARDYERGALVGGLLFAACFGAMLLHWAVVL